MPVCHSWFPRGVSGPCKIQVVSLEWRFLYSVVGAYCVAGSIPSTGTAVVKIDSAPALLQLTF